MKYLLTLQEFEIFMSLNDTFCSIKFDKKKTVFTLTAMGDGGIKSSYK
jgi:hypothetical protein